MDMNDKELLNQIWKDIHEKTMQTSQEIGSQFPTMTKNGKYELTERYSAWTTGFWPGLLWLLYEDTKYESYQTIAIECEKKLDEAIDEFYGLGHDIGFIWQLTAIKHYELTGNEVSLKRAIVAASFLASRFNIKGNFLQAWNKNGLNDANPHGLSIIDSMMNLPILMFASAQLEAPRFELIARAHADTVLKEFIREDGSVNHMVEFNPLTGEKIQVHGGQGQSPTSAWSRGTSWALHGMARFYGLTQEKKYLDAAKKVADFFISQLPQDNVPHWDFRVERTAETPRDTSAGACAACGLIELSQYVDTSDKEYYLNAALKIIVSLYENYSTLKDDEYQGLIKGGTFNHPQGLGIDISLIYGDYYFTEAVMRLRRLQ